MEAHDWAASQYEAALGLDPFVARKLGGLGGRLVLSERRRRLTGSRSARLSG
jgi:hypothetical protein